MRLFANAKPTAAFVQKQKQSSSHVKQRTGAPVIETRKDEEPKVVKHAKRNELGVQLLSRELHSQIFSNVSFPPPDPAYVRIAQEHLQMHGLDPKQGSVLPDTGFTLPPLQGRNIDEHFHRIGARSAQPWLSLAQEFASIDLPPKPDCWDIQSGWTKYHFLPDGSSYSEHVDYPQHDGKPEEMLTFDVETMPPYHPFAVIACAASKHAWYAWISPWLLGESPETQHLIPLGDPNSARVVVGHNVSYDRARILDEYSLLGTQTRFLDTMALHVAVKGISSHQRPAWIKHRKSKEKQQERRAEAVQAAVELMRDAEEQYSQEPDSSRKEELGRLRSDIAESLPQLQADEDDADISSKRWEDLTSANSLADVAKLHCDIDMDKTVRNDFMKSTPSEIASAIPDYLSYCAHDVFVTHAVFSQVLPAFLVRCPSPVSFAGILAMGSSFLTVDKAWETYLRDAERTYRELDGRVKKRLVELAEEARGMMESESWKENPWLAQLDWTPKVAGKSRGVLSDSGESVGTLSTSASKQKQPAWYRDILRDGPLHSTNINRVLPLLLRLSFDGMPLQYSKDEKWHYIVNGAVTRLPSAAKTKTLVVLGASHGLPYLKNGRLASSDVSLAIAVAGGDKSAQTERRILDLAKSVYEAWPTTGPSVNEDPWLCQLEWKAVPAATTTHSSPSAKPKSVPKPQVLWPKWYWDLAKPKKDMPPGTLDITVRSRIAPLLLRLSWLGWPLFHSREHGWTFCVQNNNNHTNANADFTTRLTPLAFYDPADDALQEASLRGGCVFYKLPHKDGEKANVGSPLGKTFMKFVQDGTLTGPGEGAGDALDMNAQCSYWISARDRILNQLVVWQDKKLDLRFKKPQEGSETQKWGVIIPQVITMGTVTRRAIEKTWLTASNAKKNRVGSELKAMVRAPDGYAIVGADVDSEELWISSCMGDAQFGLHGATAIGWMTLEGTKAAGTDLHSKTAGILGISRDQAKVFNYSRIYGAGMRHAVLLLLQSNGAMLPDQAQKLAENLYSSTKGKNTHRSDIFGRKFWFGGTESFVFNKLEEIALSDRPKTPALGCGITAALSKEHLPAEFGSDYMTSRINWVVQSSGVDYLHLLIVAMDHLIHKYDIKARYLISVHDELRYLVVEEDRYRAALALQIANLWTRSLFAYRLGMDDLPQGVAFFSAVDVDTVLRKEVDMPCVTPSHPDPIPSGESLNITKVLEKTSGGSLWRDGAPMTMDNATAADGDLEGYHPPDCLTHRAQSAAFLRAQATSEFAEVKHLAQQVSGKAVDGGIGGARNGKKPMRSRGRIP
ncbi:gamma DNA-directed DNA polymerase [Leucogyrophana mollusca]|uniref:Gamma DNA-directed DNA polymerase n=1 Tax=Leucogyrophana mollusca TaxID=85980 RepID=A0ACB8BN01_9AGAM|nr:gamma DNA-directed DNA polymerase [Leucogyrophana mollusca]